MSLGTVLLVLLGVLALIGAVALLFLVIRRARANAMWKHVDNAINLPANPPSNP